MWLGGKIQEVVQVISLKFPVYTFVLFISNKCSVSKIECTLIFLLTDVSRFLKVCVLLIKFYKLSFLSTATVSIATFVIKWLTNVALQTVILSGT